LYRKWADLFFLTGWLNFHDTVLQNSIQMPHCEAVCGLTTYQLSQTVELSSISSNAF